MLHELGRQPELPPEVWGDLAQERQIHRERSEAALEWLKLQPSRLAEGLRVLQVRCPTKGCLFAEVYRFPLAGTDERFLARCIAAPERAPAPSGGRRPRG